MEMKSEITKAFQVTLFLSEACFSQRSTLKDCFSNSQQWVGGWVGGWALVECEWSRLDWNGMQYSPPSAAMVASTSERQ